MNCVFHFATVNVPVWTCTSTQWCEQTKLARCSRYFHWCHFEFVQFQEYMKMEQNMDFKPQTTPTGVTYGSWEKQAGETERMMGEVKVHRMYSKVACIQRFTWLWSSPQFCTRNREGVQKGQRGKRSLAKLERRGRTEARKPLTGQRKHFNKRSYRKSTWEHQHLFYTEKKDKR